MTLPHTAHIPVLLKEVLRYADPKKGETWVDGTFGAGGYSRAFLASGECNIHAIDRDPHVDLHAKAVKDLYKERFTFHLGCFSDIDTILHAEEKQKLSGIILDLGVSSMQLAEGKRGFSFKESGPLDMRMSQTGMDAAHFLNQVEEKELADILYTYGGEKKSRAIAKAIVHARAKKPLESTAELTHIIISTVGRYNDTIHPATRSFQAIRIHVNDELNVLRRFLEKAENLLNPHGKILIVSFHSLEDEIVKRNFKKLASPAPSPSRYVPMQDKVEERKEWKLLATKAIHPSKEEIRANPRSRSACLRVIQKCGEGERKS